MTAEEFEATWTKWLAHRDVSVTALTLAMSVMGNVRTQTLRAFEAKEMQLTSVGDPPALPGRQ